MVFCPKCGAEVGEDMAFCPKCGAPLKGQAVTAAAPPDWRAARRAEHYNEKAEKREKQEKGEKHEKGGFPYIGPVIGGLILIFIGLSTYFSLIGYNLWTYAWPVIFVVIGLFLIFGALFRTRRRNPQP